MSQIDDVEIDEEHPIPNLEVIDVWTVLKEGGCRMFVIIASPLQGDRRSLERLMCKLERYLAYLKSDECVEKCGEATVENTTIIVAIHPESSHFAFELLERNKGWVSNNDATLVIDRDGILERTH